MDPETEYLFFVILNKNDNYEITPLMEDEYNMATFDNHSDATKAAQENPLGRAFGFKVFQMF